VKQSITKSIKNNHRSNKFASKLQNLKERRRNIDQTNLVHQNSNKQKG